MKWQDQVTLISLILSIFLIIIVLAKKNYSKRDEKVITIRKMTFLSIILAITIAISFIAIPFGIPGFSPKITLDYIPVVLVGFIFGPLEGMLFGIMSDSILLMMQGFPWQFFMAIQKPIIGLLGALVAYIYKKDIIKNKFLQIAVMQVSIFSILIASTILIFTVPAQPDLPTDNPTFISIIMGSSVVSVLFMEVMFIYMLKNNKKDLDIFVLSMMVIIIARIINSWFFTSIAQSNMWGIPFGIGISQRIITTTIAAPINGFVLYWILKGTIPIFDRTLGKNLQW